jgi:NAD+ synthase (glutamine-hydrolysing)
MPFPVLDACFHLFAEEKMAPGEVEEVLRGMFVELPEAVVHAHVEKFVRLFLGSIYKWVQAPLSLHLGNLDLDRERALQLPVVNRPEWAWPKQEARPLALAPKAKARASKAVKGKGRPKGRR